MMQSECYVGHITADYENYDFYEWLGSGETRRREDGTPQLPTQKYNLQHLAHVIWTCPYLSQQRFLFL